MKMILTGERDGVLPSAYGLASNRSALSPRVRETRSSNSLVMVALRACSLRYPAPT